MLKGVWKLATSVLPHPGVHRMVEQAARGLTLNLEVGSSKTGLFEGAVSESVPEQSWRLQSERSGFKRRRGRWPAFKETERQEICEEAPRIGRCRKGHQRRGRHGVRLLVWHRVVRIVVARRDGTEGGAQHIDCGRFSWGVISRGVDGPIGERGWVCIEKEGLDCEFPRGRPEGISIN